MTTGYLHPAYAQSLREFGMPREWTNSGSWILEREIHHGESVDGMGCYPVFSCRNWSGLREDLSQAADSLVSVSLVTDPFGDYRVKDLKECFADVMYAFKEHFVVDLSLPVHDSTTKHHRYYARKAFRDLEVEVLDEPSRFLNDWAMLYTHLIKRHDLQGIQAFSRDAFEAQLNVPGIIALTASHHGQTVGAHLWYQQGDVAYSHLAATTELGYSLMASYALYWRAIEFFSNNLAWMNLGSGAGMKQEGSDGLTRFKQGWASGTKTAYFCGRILDHEKYVELVAASGVKSTDFFPAYRAGDN